ncbi:eCIS core domain-containing protein [Deinococcus gobiensis]|nr:DUF4157 domain-containing protein [Deinococcus gobiensis]
MEFKPKAKTTARPIPIPRHAESPTVEPLLPAGALLAQGLQRLISTPVQSQRQAARPVLQAAGLRRQEEQRTLLQRQVLEQQARTVHLPTDTTRQVLLRQSAPPPPVPRQPQSPADWVAVMHAQAEQIEGRVTSSREAAQFSALQRQVAQTLVQGFRADRRPAQERHDSCAAHLVALQRHPSSAPVAGVVLGLIPQGERLALQRAVDLTRQREQAQAVQDQQALEALAIQRQLAELDAEATQPVLQRIQARRGGGNPLPAAVQRHLEQGLNHDLSQVRIHDDAEADKLAKGVNAVAFTTGTDIFFRRGQFNPNTRTGLELLAHEVTHTVQQSRGQVGTGIDPDAGLEGEARRMGVKLAQFMPSPKTLLPPIPHQQGPHAPGVYSPAAALTRARSGAVTTTLHRPFQALGLQRQSTTIQRSFIGDQLGSLAGQIPGYRELCLAFGKDLVTGKTLKQDPNTVLDALAGFVPGPFKDMLRAVRQQNLIPKAWAWFQGELGKLQLGGTLTEVKTAITKFPPDLGTAKAALTRRADGLKRLISGAGRHLAGIALTAIEAGLGPVGKKVMGLLGDVVMQVLRDPAKFAGNLLRALTQGFTQFRTNAGRWLKDGLGTWLTGTSGIQFPATLDLKGVFLTALSVMGLTYQALRGRLVKELGQGGEQKVALAEKGGGALASLTKGLHQAPEVKGQQSAVGQGVVDNLKKEVTTSLVTAGAAKVASLLVPGGAFVQALLTAFTGVQTLISQGGQIMGVILNALGSVQAIAAGQVAAAAGFVESTIGGSVPIVLTFLGRLVGLGNIGTRIRNTVKKLRTRLDATIEKLMVRVKKAIGQVKTKGQTVTSKVKAAFSGIFKKQSFNAGKEQHSIYFQAKNGRVQLMFASTPREASLQLDYLQHECEALADPIHRNEGLNHIQRARTLAAPTTAQLTTVQDEKDLEKITFDPGLDDCLKQIYVILQRNFMGALDDYVKIQTPIRYDRREQFFKFKSAGQEYNIYISKQGFPQFGPYATHTVKIDMKGNREYTLPDGDFANANIKAGFAKSKKHKGYTWHHHEDRTTMQLVPYKLHDKFRHSGGVSLIDNLGEA